MPGLAAAASVSFLSAFALVNVICLLDRHKRKPLRLLAGVFVWGAAVATFGAIIAESLLDVATGVVFGSYEITSQLGGSVYAPIVEESLKGFAILIVLIYFSSQFDDVMDGIVYAVIVALGFAATENTLYLQSAFEIAGTPGLAVLWFVRIGLGGWCHPFFTSLTGIGLAMAWKSHDIGEKLSWPLLGLVMAMIMHGLFNTMAIWNGPVTLLFDLAGWTYTVILLALLLRK